MPNLTSSSEGVMDLPNFSHQEYKQEMLIPTSFLESGK